MLSKRIIGKSPYIPRSAPPRRVMLRDLWPIDIAKKSWDSLSKSQKLQVYQGVHKLEEQHRIRVSTSKKRSMSWEVDSNDVSHIQKLLVSKAQQYHRSPSTEHD